MFCLVRVCVCVLLFFFFSNKMTQKISYRIIFWKFWTKKKLHPITSSYLTIVYSSTNEDLFYIIFSFSWVSFQIMNCGWDIQTSKHVSFIIYRLSIAPICLSIYTQYTMGWNVFQLKHRCSVSIKKRVRMNYLSKNEKNKKIKFYGYRKPWNICNNLIIDTSIMRSILDYLSACLIFVKKKMGKKREKKLSHKIENPIRYLYVYRRLSPLHYIRNIITSKWNLTLQLKWNYQSIIYTPRILLSYRILQYAL